jgi:ribosomal protein L22
LKLLESVEANAHSKGLTKDLYITHMIAQRGPAIPRGGRVPGEGKRAHIEIVLEEKQVVKKEHVSKKKAKK